MGSCDVSILTVDFYREINEDCYAKLFSYEYINTTTTSCAEIVYNLWEVRNSSNELLISLETASLSNFIYAFPYLDTFNIKLTVRDFLTNQDVKMETYIVDECPIYPDGAPSIPAMTEKNNVEGRISVIDMKTEYLEICPINIKARKVKESNL
jgi:hypothetical protein